MTHIRSSLINHTPYVILPRGRPHCYTKVVLPECNLRLAWAALTSLNAILETPLCTIDGSSGSSRWSNTPGKHP